MVHQLYQPGWKRLYLGIVIILSKNPQSVTFWLYSICQNYIFKEYVDPLGLSLGTRVISL